MPRGQRHLKRPRCEDPSELNYVACHARSRHLHREPVHRQEARRLRAGLRLEQVQYNLLFRWFIGLSMEDSVWVPAVFSKNRERLIEHDAVVVFVNEVLEQAERKNPLTTGAP
jgi:hypothetical protein